MMVHSSNFHLNFKKVNQKLNQMHVSPLLIFFFVYFIHYKLHDIYIFSSPMFGISIFSQPEHYIALYLNLFQNTDKSLQQLHSLLTRTKNPPIAAIYTSQLLQRKTISEYGLDIIRFLSQLSDLSDGASMSSSLYNVIGQSSFLTQMRHNLTHKIKISDYLIETSRKLLLKELKEKYWDTNFQRYLQSYSIEITKINQHYQRIYDDKLTEEMITKINKIKRKVTKQWLVVCSNYQFKQFFLEYFQLNTEQVYELIKQLSAHKKAIGISLLINKFCYNNKQEQFCQKIIKIIRICPQNIFKEPLIFSSLKKLTFIHYVGLCHKVIEALPPAICKQLAIFWKTKEDSLKEREANKKIYKIYGARLLEN